MRKGCSPEGKLKRSKRGGEGERAENNSALISAASCDEAGLAHTSL